MSQRDRRHFSDEEKLMIPRLYFLEGKPVTEDCEVHMSNPSLFYKWQRTFLETGSRTWKDKGSPMAKPRS